MNKLYYYLLFFLVCCGLHYDMQAQVTIGDGTPPQNFSILELSSKTTNGGIRLPHLTTAERNALNNSNTQFQAEMGRVVNDPVSGSRPGLALGLTIYNTDTQCIEYWDGYKWVSLCLGTAEIKLKETCGATSGYYDSANPPVSTADGIQSDCFYTPEETPPCIVTSGEEYQIYITAGDGYADLLRDDFTTSFSVRFQPNNTNKSRNAVVRIVNNCTGEFKDFIFTQAGATCPTTPPFSLNATTLDLCSGGSVYAYVQNPDPTVDYVWTFGGAIVHTGTWYEIKRSGIYTVYPGLVGCQNQASVTVTAKSDVAPSPLTISATNGGILCAGGNVILTAANATTVQWYHNGVPYTPGGTANPLTVTGATMAGQWFAVATDANGCNSTSSNIINLIDNTTNGTTALDAPVLLIDGAPTPFAGINICKGSVVVLDLYNAGVYTAGTLFEWFVNGTSIGASANAQKDYTVPAGATNLVFAVQVSNSGINCPNTTVSFNIPVTSIAPDRTSINNGQVNGYVCGANPAILTAAYQAGTEYEWRRDGVKIVGANTFQYTTDVLGVYTVRYKSSGGCWSRFSPAITVIKSSPITMMWELEPSTKAIYGDNKTYSVKTAPIGDSYTWTATGSVTGAIPMYPSGNGSLATISYPTLTEPLKENITINVTATNGCGTTTLSSGNVELGPGCIPVTSVNINPPGKSTIYIPGNLTFTATSEAGALYTWYLDNVEVQAQSTLNTYNYVVPSNTSPGTHKLSVKASACSTSATAEVTVVVVPDPTSPSIPEYTGNKAFFTGQVCFDVNKTTSPNCGDVSGRIDAFADTKTFNYILVPDGGAVLSDIAFVVKDNSTLLDAVTPYTVNDKVLTINFRSNIRDHIANNGDAIVTLYAIFKINNGSFQKLMLTLNVKDCSCCGAFVQPVFNGPVSWKTFQCHNLGADTSKKPNVFSKEIAGSYYQWGRKNPGATSDSGASAISGWSSSGYPKNPWNLPENNPCPSGFRVPTDKELETLVGLKKMNPVTHFGTWNADQNNFSAGFSFGFNLFLPANGYRSSGTGALVQRGLIGYYWSSIGVDTPIYYPSYQSSYQKASALFLYNPSPTGVGNTESTYAGGSVRCVSVD